MAHLVVDCELYETSPVGAGTRFKVLPKPHMTCRNDETQLTLTGADPGQSAVSLFKPPF